MPEYLVTGGAGFIGSHLVERLVAQRVSVRVFDNFGTGKRGNIEPFLDHIELIEGDLRDAKAVREACEDVRFVLHAAAVPSVPRSVAEPLETNEVNVTGTMNLLLAAREAKCRRFVFSSSSSVYGDTPTLPKREEMLPVPLSPYALQKLAGEHYCRLFWELYRFEAVSLRYFNVFGPRQDPNSQYAAAIPRFTTAIIEGKAPPVFGDGKQSRDFCFVANVVDANLAACQAPHEACGEVINIACGEPITILRTIQEINRILGRNLPPHFLPRRVGDVLHSHADIAKAGRLLKYRPSVSFAQGMETTVRWFAQGQ
jgi:nucleoside-diphosphate-sugar epimerase